MKYTGRCGQNGLNIVQGYAEPLAAHEREARVRPHRIAALPAGQREEQRVLGPGEQLDDPVQEAGALERAEGGGGEGSHVGWCDVGSGLQRLTELLTARWSKRGGVTRYARRA